MKNYLICLQIVVFVFLIIFSINLVAQDEYKSTNLCLIDDHETDVRMLQYDVGFYFLDINLNNTNNFIYGSVRIDLNFEDNYNDELVLDFKSNMLVDSIKINDNLVNFNFQNDLIIINYENINPYNSDYDASAIIYYKGNPSDGLFNSSEWYGGAQYSMTYSLSEPYLAKYWFPCKQVLSDKADSSYCYISIPENLKAGSNGLLKNTVNLGNGNKRMEWESNFPIAFYLISVAVADYQDYSFYVDIPDYDTQVLVQNFIPNNTTYFDQNIAKIDKIEEMLQLLSEKWGLYPFYSEKYGHCIAPLGGGMEHQTMTSLKSFSFRLVLHELAHSWFGNFVTCKTWQDIWINEGFASYGEYLGEEFIQPEGFEMGWLDEAQSLAKQSNSSSVYVPFNELNNISRIFDSRLSYKKGACLVHIIRYIIDDDDLFFASLREFIQQYANSSADAEDFKMVLEEMTGLNFNNFFEEWYYGQGYPIYSALWWTQNSNILHIELSQTTSSTATSLFTTPLEFMIIYDNDNFEIVRKDIAQNDMSFDIEISGEPIQVILNPTNAVLADVTSVQNLNEIFANSQISVFPNPSDGLFTVISDNFSEKTFELYTSSGNLLKSFCVNSQKTVLDISELADGVYFLKCKNCDNIRYNKLVIAK